MSRLSDSKMPPTVVLSECRRPNAHSEYTALFHMVYPDSGQIVNRCCSCSMYHVYNPIQAPADAQSEPLGPDQSAKASAPPTRTRIL